ncbi:MAG: hypothetical protein AAF721_37160 [Myxococcota bacterium]
MATIAGGFVLAGIGSAVAMAGVLATAYADSPPATGLWAAGTADHAAATTRTAAMLAAIKHDRTLSYPLAQVWPATLRYLRVDRGYTLVDRDAEAGYVLFDFPLGRPGDSSGGVARGSIEMFATEDMSGRPSVRIQISTEGGPSHLPHALAEGLAGKLRDERGAPAPPPKKTRPSPDKPKPDDGAPPMVDPPIDP